MTVNLLLAVTIGGLFAAGVYLMLSRNLIRVILGFLLAGHGINLLLLSVGTYGAPPIVGEATGDEQLSDPIPQALILTSIVITLAVSTFLLAMAYRNYTVTRDPELTDDPEDDEFADADAGAGAGDE
jgi:multicomponent Na+:H+ antiporter subunit C